MVSLLIRRVTVCSVRAIRDAADRLQGGDLCHRVPMNGRDEIADTAGAFNSLIVSFQGAVQTVSREAGLVADSSHALAGDAARVSDGSVQQSETLQTVAAMEQLAVSIGAISDSAAGVRAAARESQQNAEAGAGEAGRGFAVVADGVRSLAEQTTAVEQGLQRGHQALGSRRAHAETLGSVVLRAREEVSRSLEQMAQTTQTNLDAVRHTAESTVQLADYARNLQAAVGRFQV